ECGRNSPLSPGEGGVGERHGCTRRHLRLSRSRARASRRACSPGKPMPPTTYSDLIASVRKSTRQLSIDDLKRKFDAGEKMTLLDVREKEEFRAGFIPGAMSLPRGFLEMNVEQRVPDKNAPIVVYCAGGSRSVLAAASLQELGYTNVQASN